MFPALPPEGPIINSASYFRIVNIDYEKKKSDELIYLGKTGVIKYEWSNDFKSIEGTLTSTHSMRTKPPLISMATFTFQTADNTPSDS